MSTHKHKRDFAAPTRIQPTKTCKNKKEKPSIKFVRESFPRILIWLFLKSSENIRDNLESKFID